MLKTKKRGLLVIFAFALVLALSCGAWAATAEYDVDSTHEDITVPVIVSGDAHYALRAQTSDGSITYTGGQVETDGKNSQAVAAWNHGVIIGTGSVTTSGDTAHGLAPYTYGDITWTGNIETMGDTARGAFARINSSLDITGDIVTHGNVAHGLSVINDSYAIMKGDITTYGDSARGITMSNPEDGYGAANIAVFVGNIVTYGDVSGDVEGDAGAIGVSIVQSSDLTITGDVTTHGKNGVGLFSGLGATLTMNEGTITVADPSYSLEVGNDGTINLNKVTAESANLLTSGGIAASNDYVVDSSGTVNATNSTLAGDILHPGISADVLALNLKDSEWSGAAEASGDIGQIDLTLESSTWNVTGDSDTNGKLAADSDSVINYGDAPADTTVAVDTFEGDPALDMKPGDKLVIKDGDSVVSLVSNNPDVIEVVQNDDGEWEIISKGEGEAELEYTYIDSNDEEQTVTIGVSSSDGIVPDTSGGKTDPNNIKEGDTDIEVVYDFGMPTIEAIKIDNAGMAGSGLLGAIVDGKVVLTGTAETAGEYFYVVTLRDNTDGRVFTKKVPVVIQAGSGPTDDDSTRRYGSSGCNAGFGILALLGLAFVAKKK